MLVSFKGIYLKTEIIFVCICENQVMANQEAVDIARKVKDPLKAAKQLTAEALKRESKDDISCVVVRFRWWLIHFKSGFLKNEVYSIKIRVYTYLYMACQFMDYNNTSYTTYLVGVSFD